MGLQILVVSMMHLFYSKGVFFWEGGQGRIQGGFGG